MHSIVVLDSCVLYPAPLRDFLLRLATAGLFAARWTEQIHEEWTRNLLLSRPELTGKLSRTIKLMNQAIPGCLVTGYEPLINGLTLPDPNDRHVLAAAIRTGAQLIVTINLKDFPPADLAPFDIVAIHPDAFASQQFDLNPAKLLGAARSHRSSLRNPAKSVDQYLETLAAHGLVLTVDRMREFEEML